MSLHSNVELLADFFGPHMQRMVGEAAEVAVIYEWYSDWWADFGGSSRPLSAKAFWKALNVICRKTRIRLDKIDGKVCALDVRLIDPSLKALVRPANNSPIAD